MPISVASLLGKYPIISDQISRQGLEVVLGQVEKVLQAAVPGDIVEFGCYIGTTSLFIRRMLDDGRQFHVYDSFAGLPPKAAQDMTPVGADFKAGELSVSKKQLLAEFHKAGLRPPTVHKGWFSDLTAKDVPEQIAFAFLDGDFYDSILDSLRLVWPRLQPGGVVCIDDYQREALPGVAQAVRDFFQGSPPPIKVAHNIGVMIKSETQP